MLKRMRRRVGRIERRLRALPTYVVVVGSVLVGMLLTLMGESAPAERVRPRPGEIWFPMASGGEGAALVFKTKHGTCRKDGWLTRAAQEGFLAVQVPKETRACTCVENLSVVADRASRHPSCEAAGMVSYGAL